MFLYSKKIIQFVQEIKVSIRSIISHEMGLKVFNERFYDEGKHYSYPIKIVIFNHKRKLGYFDPEFYEIGINECMMSACRRKLHDLIRHELAHYMAFIQYGKDILPHGEEFKFICKQMGWGESIYRASQCIQEEGQTIEEEKSHVFRKIQKLMALSLSQNPHESELAILKAQELLLKHNIEEKQIPIENEEKMILSRIMKQKKENAKMRAISKILETFFVSIVYRRSSDFIYLEILGSPTNVEVASYVADFLDQEFEKLFIEAKLKFGLSGRVAKNSFFLGVAKGYCNKISALKSNYGSTALKGLMIIEKQLMETKSLVYPRLRQSKSSMRSCHESLQAGEIAGNKLSIHPAVKSSRKNFLLLQ